MKYSLLVIAVMIIIIGAFFFGRQSATDKIQNNFTENIVMVKEIAEMSALEVDGIAKLERTNVAQNPGILDQIAQTFTEKTQLLEIPYQAKYGFDLNTKFKIENKNDEILVTLPQPKLLSLELRMDKSKSISKTGLFVGETDDAMLKMSQNLYEMQRAESEKDEQHLHNAKVKAVKLYRNYFSPFGKVVNVRFDGDSAAVSDTIPKL